VLAILLLAGAGVFTVGITWGLPSRAVDRYLFGDHPVWSGRQIRELAGERRTTATRGADMDVDPLTGRDRPVCVNENDAQRAEIVRRYRLYSHQPDEMVTMMALASMRPGSGDLDPKMYQYGGLWIYPVGILLKCASVARVVTLTSDLTYYLDDPEAFGRFYVVARAYVVAWALAGVWTVFRISHRLGRQSLTAAATAAACFIAMPVVINMAHEAKPHLPGAVLMLLAVLAAMKCLETNSRGWWLCTCVLSGAAFGMVLSCWPVFAVPVVLASLRRADWSARLADLAVAGAVGLLTYFATNPYVAINLLTNRELVHANLANTQGMFHIGHLKEMLPNALRLMIEAASGLVLLFGMFGLAAGATGRRARAHPAWLLAVPAVLVLLQFVVFAAGQPAEYARFAVFAAIALAISAGLFAGLQDRPVLRLAFPLLLVAATVRRGAAYELSCIRDARETPSRMLAAEGLHELAAKGGRNLAVCNEPAPYAVPPVNLFEWRIWLMPRGQTALDPAQGMDVAVMAVDDLASTPSTPGASLHSTIPRDAPMSWADKVFVWVTRLEAAPTGREAVNHAP
jgi:hypothetical protein